MNGEAGMWSPPSPAVSFSIHAPHQINRGDRGPQSASEVNGMPERGARCHIDPVATYRYPSIPVGSTDSAGGLEDEDEDEDDWTGLMCISAAPSFACDKA